MISHCLRITHNNNIYFIRISYQQNDSGRLEPASLRHTTPVMRVARENSIKVRQQTYLAQNWATKGKNDLWKEMMANLGVFLLATTFFYQILTTSCYAAAKGDQSFTIFYLTFLIENHFWLHRQLFYSCVTRNWYCKNLPVTSHKLSKVLIRISFYPKLEQRQTELLF